MLKTSISAIIIIIKAQNHRCSSPQVKDAVIASHPNYSHSYAPAVVMGLTSDLYFTLRFYDGAEGSLPHDEVYHLAAEKFETDVSYIVQWENCWVGQAVVARNDDTGTFELGRLLAIFLRMHHVPYNVYQGFSGFLRCTNGILFLEKKKKFRCLK